MNTNEMIENAVRSVKGAMFCVVSYNTKNDTLMKSKIDGSKNPYWDQKDYILKVVEDCQLNLCTYTGAVNRQTDEIFEAVPMRGKVEHEKPHRNICVAEKDKSKVYIRYMPILSKKMTVKYMLGGVDITAGLELYKKPKVMSATQAAAGVSEKDEIQWRTLTIDNITSMKIGGVEIRR